VAQASQPASPPTGWSDSRRLDLRSVGGAARQDDPPGRTGRIGGAIHGEGRRYVAKSAAFRVPEIAGICHPPLSTLDFQEISRQSDQVLARPLGMFRKPLLKFLDHTTPPLRHITLFGKI